MNKRTAFSVRCAAWLLALTLPSGVAMAQILYGSLTGNVTDPSTAVVPGAKVVALNTGTGAAHEDKTDSAGTYTFNNLQPGKYKVTVTAPSFRTVIADDIQVAANQVRRVDLALQIATATETVEISVAATALLQTDRADVNTTLDSNQLANLPMSSSAGRNFQALYKLVPGFSLVTEGVSSDGGNPQRSMSGFVNGTSRQNNLTRIDGASNTYMWLPSNTAYVPPTESIETVNIATNSFDAEQGNAVGAAVNVVTKSGTNAFHGSLFEYHTDNGLKAVERFRPAGFRNSKSILNQYGGSAGGPIRKNKLFFFADWEGTKRRQFATRSGTVINPAGIFDSAGNANLSAAIPAGTNCNTTPVAGCVFDPSTGKADGSGRTAFPGNIIPASRIDAAAKTILGRVSTAGFLNSLGVTANNNYCRPAPPNSTATLSTPKSIMCPVHAPPSSAGTVFRRPPTSTRRSWARRWAGRRGEGRWVRRLPESRTSD